jgi:DNA-binding beta-propeller fold protein YncE
MLASTKGLNRREWLATSVFASLAGCISNEATGFNGYGLVANAGDNSLTAVDLTTFRLASTRALGASPSQIVVFDRQAYVLTPSNGTVHLIDSNLARAKSKRLASDLSQIGLSSGSSRLLALSSGANQLIEANLNTLEPVSRHKLSVTAASMDSSSTGYVAVASSSGSVELIHLASGQRTRTETPPLGSIRFRADGKLLLAANLHDRSLLALDVPSLRTVAELPLAMRPDHMCFNYDQGQLFVSGSGMDGVAVVFPYDTLEVDQTLLAGRDPGTMTCSASPAYLFVASRTGSDVCILNIDTRKVVGFVEMGGQPSFITTTPDSQYALVLDQLSGDMGVIRIPAVLTNRSKKLGWARMDSPLFTVVSVGNRPVDLAVIPRAAS